MEAPMTTPKIPLGLFAIPFGLAGLAEAWLALASGHHAPVAVSEVILLISALAWLASDGLFPHAATPGRAITDVFIALTVLLGGRRPVAAGRGPARIRRHLLDRGRLAYPRQAQLRLLPAYLKLPFMPGTRAFTFSSGAVVAAAIVWLQSTQPPGYLGWQYVLIVGVTALIGGIAVRTVIAISRHQLLPQLQPPPPNRAAPTAAPAIH
jgi:hypothetical protein